jgi:TonB-dependent SusC/RagA subfamily outer membrane receptor
MKKNREWWALDRYALKKSLKIMRWTLLFFFLGIIQAFAVEESYAQKTKLELSFSQAKLEQVLNEIENQSEFYFLYNQDLVNTERKVDIQAKGTKIEEVLHDLFVGTDVRYTIIDRQIVLTNNSDQTNLVELIAQQQAKKVSGKVSDNTGTLLPGVSVVVKGTTIGTVSDANGIYSLSGIPVNSTLQFSFVGMTMREIKIGTKTEIDIVLEAGSIGLEEIVAVGYGTNKKRDISGAISTLKSDELNVTPMASTTNALSGKIPGLQTMQTTGEPGNDASRLSIRGFGTALVIVDGVEQSFNNNAGAEIESISVLKDASAAIYGARAGNGVILVTTKRGKTGKPAITFNSSISYSGNINYPKPMSAGQYTELYRESQLNSGVKPELAKYSPADIRNYYAGTNQDSTNTDWWKATMNDWAPMQQYDLSLRGGNEAVRYYAFAGYTRQDGMFKTGDNLYNRFNVRSNIDATVAKNLTMELNLSAIIGDLSGQLKEFRKVDNFGIPSFGQNQPIRLSYPTTPKPLFQVVRLRSIR